MKRIFGIMPSNEVEVSKRYHTGSGFHVTVQAGPNGWGILFADSSAEGQDIVDTTEANIERAIAKLKGYFTEVTEVEVLPDVDVVDDSCGREECCDEES